MRRTCLVHGSSSGPFRADQIHEGDRYELSHGHPVYCAPTGGQGASGNASGVLTLLTDPDALSGGVDAGFSPDGKTLRAPDVAVGNVPETPGWIPGVPPLAVEYADRGQDEEELRAKIHELLEHGTRYVWVVRLVGPRRVEAHEPGTAVRTLVAGQTLQAPGVLRNPVPVEALYDREIAVETALQNLLQRKGYASLNAVREEGHMQGHMQGQAQMLLTLLEARGLRISKSVRQRILSCTDPVQLERWGRRAVSISKAEELFQA